MMLYTGAKKAQTEFLSVAYLVTKTGGRGANYFLVSSRMVWGLFSMLISLACTSYLTEVKGLNSFLDSIFI